MELHCAILLCIVIALISISPYTSSQEFLVKTIANGQIRGKYELSRGKWIFESYLNIPFAKPPVRFEPPEEPENWEGIYNATVPGYKCPQVYQNGYLVDESEDCLNLNVHAPAELASNISLPVMFWIHGGGYRGGSGSEFGPTYLMDKNVVLVTINYRLGPFGFLNTEDELVRGNMGFKDMIMALKWVQSNIHVFGGNPQNVMIFGQSAGSGSVHSLMLSPAAKGLFHKVIVQSGSALANWNTAVNPAETFKGLAQRAGCTGSNNSVVVECMRGKSITEILKAQNDYIVGSLAYSPSIDPQPNKGDYSVFPEPFERLIETGNNSRHLPLVIGRVDVEWRARALGALRDTSVVALLNSNWTEGLLQLADFSRFVHLNDSVTRVAEAIREFYFNGRTTVANDAESAESLEQMLTDFDFLWNVKNSVILSAKYGGNVYAYTFLYQGNFSHGDPGAEGHKRPAHGDDYMYLFPALREPNINYPDLEPGSEDEDFSKKIVSLWASFAASDDGVPDSSILGGEWKPVPKDLALDSRIEWYLIKEDAHSELETDRLRDRAKFWNQVFG